jgi:hypothetical protein
MEMIIPLFALGSLYVVTNQKKTENFANKTKELPNTNIPNKNYPSEYPIHSAETEQTSQLSHDNRYSGGAYTDKFFNPNSDSSLLGNPNQPQTVKTLNGTTTEAKYMSMTGQPVDSTYFQHNNMVPFFGGNLRTRHVDDNSNESILDSYSGTGSQIIHKTEQGPMFNPHTDLQWAHGMPSYSDFEQSRMNISMKMSNVKPFGEQKVAPGLGLGAGTEGLGGYNSGMLNRESWMEKSVDELRVSNKPKSSGLNALGREGPAISFITKQGSMGIQEKNRPDTTFEFGPERYMTTTGIEQGRVLIPIPIEKRVSRPETSTGYEGGAGYTTSAEYVPGEYMPSHNHQATGPENMGPADAQGQAVANENDYAMHSNRSYTNNRSANQSSDYFGNAGKGMIAETIAPLLDILRPSRKENSVGTLRPYQNAKPAVSESYLYNPYDKPLPTIKESTINSKFHLNVNANQRGGGYDVAAQTITHNNRDATTDYAYIGNSSASVHNRQPMSYESNYNQRNNDIKAVVADTGYTPKGYKSLFDGNQNIRQKENNEKMFNITQRALTPQFQNNSSLSRNEIGAFQMKNNPYSGMSLDRNNGDVLSQLQGNPFALSING